MKPHVGASSSRITLRALAESMIEDFDCKCVEGQCGEDTGGPYCECAGDDCWHCAALMAIANADEGSSTGHVAPTPDPARRLCTGGCDTGECNNYCARARDHEGRHICQDHGGNWRDQPVEPAPAQPTEVRGPWPPRKGDRALSTGTRDVLTFNGDRNASGGYDVTDSKGRVVGGLGKQAIDGGMFQLIGPEVVPSAPATGEGAAPSTTREETKR